MKKISKMLLVLLLTVFVMVAFSIVSNAATTYESENNNTIPRANNFTLGDTIYGDISSDDTDFFSFTLDKAGLVTITSELYLSDNSGGRANASITLYDEEGNKNISGYTSNGVDSGALTFKSAFGCFKGSEKFMLSPGTYYIEFEAYTCTASGVYDYKFETSFKANSCNYNEPDNSLSEAHNISVGKTIKGQLDFKFKGSGNDYDYDYYVFTLKSKTSLFFKFTETGLYSNGYHIPHLTVCEYDTDKEVFSSLYDKDTQTITLPAGKYYMYVWGNPRDCATYTITFNYNGWRTVDGNKYYYYKGSMIKGRLASINGNKYYFGKDGVMYKSKLISVSGKKYYIGKDGIAYKSKFGTISGKKYYFGSDCVMVKSKLISVSGKKYYMGSDGAAYKSKLISVSGKKYYIGSDCVAYKSKFASLSGKKYYFGSDCVMYKSKTFSVSGVKWKADSNGVCKKV